MIIDKVDIADIKAAKYNPRKDLQPTDLEYQKLEASIKKFGFVQPLVWNKRSGNLIAGHQRLKVLIADGMTEVTCSIVDLAPNDEKVLNIALNRVRGEWDHDKLAALLQELPGAGVDILLTGFTQDEVERLVEIGNKPLEPEGDEFKNRQAKPYICPECGHSWRD